MAIIEVDESEFNQLTQEAFEKGQRVILKFGSELCDGCMIQDMELEELDTMVDDLAIFQIDLSESDSLAYQFDITEVPTTLIYKNKDALLLSKKGIILAADMKKIIDES